MRVLTPYLSTLFLTALLSIPVSAQQIQPPIIHLNPEQGLTLESADGFMGFRLGTMMQQQAGITKPLETHDAISASLMIRRARIRLYGFLFKNKLKYYMQLQMDRGKLQLSNAEYRWKPTKNLQLNAGQLWPLGGRQFRTGSSYLQMIDRSAVARYFMPGYDLGLTGQLSFDYIKVYAGLTHGEGSNTATAPGGFAYSGRLELLPLGPFTANGDYRESDLVHEPEPRLSLGAALHYNHDAYTKMGSSLWDGRADDISSWFADGLFKYDGFSLLAEAVHREVDQEILVMDGNQIISNIISGNGLSVQAGKFISETLEPTVRLSILDPDDESRAFNGQFTRQDTYSLGINHFIRGHNMKIQCEVDLVNEHFTHKSDHTYLQLLSQISLTL